ncbi:MauE/DoxX family redox-associated membrane protein [Mycobacterium riyadhense]|nr:MauE/DoxX family redox-associated membrane protein [Mycobacterium riyadhense]MCV7149422.1 thioredoxin fold domain-containing protein [Mycobacterium riyadhense]
MSHVMIWAARLLLGAMFAIAATAKLADRPGTKRAAVAFGAPSVAAAYVGSAIVATEFGIAALLLTAPRYGALAALVALTGFSAAVSVHLTRGQRLECHCFGRLSQGQLGWPTLARNGCFATLAVFVALNGQFGLLLTFFAIVLLGLWTGPAAYRRLKSPTTPGLALADRAGRTWTFDSLLEARKPLVLIFSQPGCGACDALLPEVAQWQQDGRVAVALISGGPANHTVPLELIDERRAWFAAYNITATPSAVLIDGDRKLTTARGTTAIRELVNRAEQTRFTRRGLLRNASVGLVSAGAVAACDSGSKHADTKALEVDGAWLCNQTFALCTTAPCVPSTTDPNISVCDCVVVNGYSIGFKPCPERNQSGNKVRSAFSTVNVNASFGVLHCPPGVTWANCLDVECEIDPHNPAVAKCQCLTVKTGESVTFGGGCDTATCTSTIWSAATTDLPAVAQYRKGMEQLGQPIVDLPRTCPAPK